MLALFLFMQSVLSYTNFINLRVLRGVTIISSKQPSWLNRENDVVINLPPQKYPGLFDEMWSAKEERGAYSISSATLREISSTHQFSLAFLGDFVVQLGCQPPVNVDIAIGDMLTGEQIASLMEAINSLDEVAANVEYDSFSITEVAKHLDIPLESVLEICKKENLNLPYGTDTVLHASVVDMIKDIVENGETDD